MTDRDRQVISLASADGRLRVEFDWNQDRFVHRVLLDQREVGTSVEGNATDLWPPSPPLQQLSLEPIDGRSVILGVGAAGRGHWSISVEVDPLSPSAIRFDLACRCGDKPMFLGSTYQLDDSLVLESTDGIVQHGNSFSNARRADVHLSKPAGGGTERWSYRLAPCRPEGSKEPMPAARAAG